MNPNDFVTETYQLTSSGWTPAKIGVRITHIPTGIITESSEARSLHQNKAIAVKHMNSLLERPKEGKVLVSKAALAMILNALRRDAAEGFTIRGEMVEMIEASYEEIK